MTKDEQDYKKFLEDQLDWCMEQDLILAEIEYKLQEMKGIAKDALENGLTNGEITIMNIRLNQLNSEVFSLKEKLNSIVN